MAGLNAELRIPKTIKLFINGEFPRTESGRSFAVHHPKTKKLYAHLCLASRKDFRNAVTVAREAQKGWAARSAYNRSQILYRMAEMMEGKRAEFLEVLTSTLVTSQTEAVKIFEGAIESLVYYAGFADKYQQVVGAVNPVNGPHHNFTTPEAVGTVAYVANEDFDLAELVSDIAAIICSGNSVVVLMPRKGAATLAPLAETFATSDLPKAVVNLLSGDLVELAKPIGTHMELQSLCYAGDDATHRGEFRAMAVENMKRVVFPRGEVRSLERILNFVEYKTVWHPIGE